ncbi:ATP synthase subunit gamma [Plakobranchus ocellatus]|uniref:ATP synthase subunit gamma n=1 Tax=Plakobranchus ocellatus TaxID=259542 RepID=A0AAV4DLN3_9GAST|nr:ATP synthase subunit gamma [Plakobranchus ocellatus]
MEAILSRATPMLVPQCGQLQSRGMATLKEIRIRLKSVTNIQKITKSMKMVSAAKYARAERELKPARSYGMGAKAFYEKVEVAQDETKPNHLMVAMSSDRGLCGGIHSAVIKYIKAKMEEEGSSDDTRIIVVGDKGKAILQRTLSKNIIHSFSDYGKRPPIFADAALVANTILDTDFKYDRATLVFNTFKSVISYNTTELPLFSPSAIEGSTKFNLYDSLDEDVLRCYNEFSLASLVMFAMKEGACSEQSSRMTAMDAASKNAGEMIDKLTLTFNRTRQAVITRELIEIISGAAAL